MNQTRQLAGRMNRLRASPIKKNRIQLAGRPDRAESAHRTRPARWFFGFCPLAGLQARRARSYCRDQPARARFQGVEKIFIRFFFFFDKIQIYVTSLRAGFNFFRTCHTFGKWMARHLFQPAIRCVTHFCRVNGITGKKK